MSNAANTIRQWAMWAGLWVLVLVIILVVFGAFLGTARAAVFFNSPATVLVWVLLLVLMLAGLVLFAPLHRRPGLMAMHLGSALVIAGAMWGSETAHTWRSRYLNDTRHPFRRGRMVIFEGQATDEVILTDHRTARLPFTLQLDDFSLEYYRPGTLLVTDQAGRRWSFPARIGAEYTLGDDDKTHLRIRRVFGNFRLQIDESGRRAFDKPGPSDNPALELEITGPDGTETRRYVFAHFPGHFLPHETLRFTYRLAVRDYRSTLTVLENGSPRRQKVIEVNHPLHYGGYHFYQFGYDDQAGRYTVLEVVSDAGLHVVYTGYALLIGGSVGHFWLGPLRRRRREYRTQTTSRAGTGAPDPKSA